MNAAMFREAARFDEGDWASILRTIWVALRYRPARMVAGARPREGSHPRAHGHGLDRAVHGRRHDRGAGSAPRRRPVRYPRFPRLLEVGADPAPRVDRVRAAALCTARVDLSIGRRCASRAGIRFRRGPMASTSGRPRCRSGPCRGCCGSSSRHRATAAAAAWPAGALNRRAAARPVPPRAGVACSTR